MKLLKKIARKYAFSSRLLETYFLSKKYLKPKGWILSRFLYQPVNENGKPIPWLTYSSIHFITQKLANTSFSVFEYGSGNSTLWFSERVASIISVEHSLEFYDIIKKKIQSKTNVTYLLADLNKDYSSKI
ncbi:MAG: hypothetical protein ACI9Y7_002308, partial [Dokdonia sp.]